MFHLFKELLGLALKNVKLLLCLDAVGSLDMHELWLVLTGAIG